MSEALVVRSRAFSSRLRNAAISVENEAWASLGYLNYTRAHREYYDQILEKFSEFQLCLVDPETEEPVALANCAPAAWRGDFAALPAEGWDWLVESAAADGDCGNVLGALAISVPPAQRGKGYATRMIRELRALSERHGFDALLAPVRPTAKCDYPHVPIGDYLGWRDEEGRLFDPWLRSHVSHGGAIVGPCERSMVVEQDLAFWETWAGHRIEQSGDYVLDGALVPIHVDVEQRLGRYEEPNVWVVYS